MDIHTTISGFKVNVTDEDGNIQCWIEKGACTSSLALAESVGQIEDTSDRSAPIPVSEVTLDTIRAWAEKHGY